MNELSAIPVSTDYLHIVKMLMDKCGVRPHIYENAGAWADDSSAQHKDLTARMIKREGMPTPAQDATEEHCMLLVGPLHEILSQKLPEFVNQVHPGLPVVAACDSPRLADVVSAIRQGARDVIDLSSTDADACSAIREALEYGRETEGQRLRTMELRQRLKTITLGERQVLDCMLEGLANKETAKTLSIGLRTVELRRAKIMTKMGAKGVAELIKLFCEARAPGVDTRAVR
ncbi:Transcriptional regulatory protein FixJ [Posidoniimonas polymericola]|uniref:Transcriptional regulatory protein FixJ n=1 Tax=Posidoniimonas polymericola TaxID=2528002 RepID=A0A5C5ZF33_9BACT|nr:LuxR C-terminal-related transcriptional regulator [Posidoniimonas polymericola]TWT85451.1 Transcriptional regulatory protein FixJ [Posidoniimonas polymericola]